MKTLFLALLASSALAAAIPAVAQAHDYGQGGYAGGEDWNNGGATYAQFNEEYRHIAQMIRHGASDGTLNRRQIAGSFHELRYIQSLAYSEQRNGNYNPGIVQARLTRLHDGLHFRHDTAHAYRDRAEQQNYDRGYGNTYNQRGDYRSDNNYRDQNIQPNWSHDDRDGYSTPPR